MSCVVGIDIGTTSTIGILLDTKTNKILKKVSLKVDLFSPKIGWAEENPNQWWSNTKKILIKLIQYSKLKRKKIIALGTTGMLPALVILDKNGTVIRNSIQQSDGRTGKQIKQLFNYKIQKWFVKKTKCGVNQQLIAPKLLWLKQNEKNNFKKIHTVCGSYDFINFKLTGKYSIEHNWALESGLMDFKKKKFTSDLVKLGSIKLSMLPKIFSSDQILGNISEKLAKELSLEKNVKVIAGCADHVVSAFSAGIKKSGDVLLKFGGAGDILIATNKPIDDQRLFLDYHIIPDLFMPNGCMASSGSLLNWFINNFYAHSNKLNTNIHSYLDKKSSKTDMINNKIVVLPYFLGEKTPIHDVDAKGTISGLGLNNTVYDLWIAFLESVSFGFKHHLDILNEKKLPIKNIIASDGGSKSSIWMQITSNIIQKPIKIYNNIEGSSLGAAFVAAKSVKLYHNWEDINQLIGKHKIIYPQKIFNKHYRNKYNIYLKMYEKLKNLFPLFEKIN